jgi:UDPglucose 6-dehydrogenase
MSGESVNIGIVGMWHLGCVLSAVWASKNHSVVGFDYDSSRIRELQRGKAPVFEPELDETLSDCLSKGVLSFSDKIGSLSQCDYIFLSYDTPVLDDDSSDVSILKRSVDDLKKIMKDGSILIISSQSPVGLCSQLRIQLQEVNPTLELAYSPENLRLGEAIECYTNPGRIILGSQNKITEEKCINIFGTITSNILSMSLESAELVKHGINSFLAMSIVYTNNIANICELQGGDIFDVTAGIKSDPRIGQKAYLSPGIGFSGGTLGRDLKVLHKNNLDKHNAVEFFGNIHENNNNRKLSICDRVGHLLNNFENKTVGVLGLTYKPNTSTLRRSLPLEIVEIILEKNAIVKVFDPKADYSEVLLNKKISISKSVVDVATDSDILLLLTEWSMFLEYDWSNIVPLMKNNLFFDAKNALEEQSMIGFGFQYHSIGRE